MKKTFDCVEMMHEGGRRLMAQLAAMTPEEQTAFWEEEGRKLRERQQQLREQKAQAEQATQD